MDALYSLEGKVAVVTGSKRGIGRAIALAFAEAGANVVVSSRVAEDAQLQMVYNEIKNLGRQALAIQSDITRETDVQNMVQKVISEFGAIDILVNNAGIMSTGPLLDLPEDEWDRVISTDLKSCYLCCQAVGKKMVEQKKGNIINISSAHAIRAMAERGVYAIAKAGVIVLTRVLAKELGRYNIRVNAIAPGPVRTQMSEHVYSNPDILKYWETQIPLGRIGETTDVARIALFLASGLSNYVTGQTIGADGGLAA